MEQREYRLEVIKVAISVVGLLGLAFGGTFTYLTYRQHAELQARRALNDAQLKVCQDFVSVAAKMFSAEDARTFRALHYQFSEFKHGQALALLDKDVLEKAVVVYNSSLPVLEIADGPSFRATVRCALKNSPFQLSLACRRMIAASLTKEAATTVEPIDPNYVLGWTGQCPG